MATIIGANKPGVVANYFFGDSFTLGYGSTSDNLCWVTPTSLYLGWNKYNGGVGGQTVTQGTDNPVSTSVIPTKTSSMKKLFMSWGINDSWKTVGGNPISTATYKSDYQSFINAAISKGWSTSNMFMVTGYLTKTGAYPNYDNFRTAAAEVAVANSIAYADCYTYMSNNGGQSLLWTSGAYDGHPNDAGYAVITTYLQSQL